MDSSKKENQLNLHAIFERHTMGIYNLTRFLDAQNQGYLRALDEIKSGKKQTHWMWYIFPQLAGLGHSDTAQFFAIRNLNEAKSYLEHPVLSRNLIEISLALLEVNGKTANEILGTPDDLKLRSSMTLFAQVEGADPVFSEVIEKYFEGAYDSTTLGLLRKT